LVNDEKKDAEGVQGGGGGGEESIRVYKCLTLKCLLKELNGRDADILVSNLDEKVIRNLHKIFDKTNFTENTIIYFRCDYPYYIYKINNILSRFLYIWTDFTFIKKYLDASSILRNIKNAYFDSRYSSIEEFEKEIENSNNKFCENGRRWTFTFRNNFDKSRFQNCFENSKNDYKLIYFFGDSIFAHGLSVIKSTILKENTNYRIENYSGPGFNDENVIFQLTRFPLIKNSIVIINRVFKPYLLLIAMQYCKKYNCRLIYYYIPWDGIIHRKVLTDYEKWYIEVTGLNSNPWRRLSEESEKRKIRFVAKCMDVEFYEPLEEFFNSDKTIYVDNNHFGDYGGEILAKHLLDIIVTKAPNDSPNNSNDDFSIELEEKIEYAMSVISIFIPDIQTHIANLKWHKQNCEKAGCIVMNCNPFTLGHRYLIEYASSKSEHLYIFVVEEDKSEFSFKDRYKLVKQNTKDLKNITVLPSGKLIISSLTFDAYFDKSKIQEEQAIEQDVSSDLLIFAAAIAPTLNIKTRFVGQEPFDALTRHYNEEMKNLLPEYGCDVVEIPRLEKNDTVVSASRVRKFLKDGNFDEIRKIVPKATLKYLKSRSNFSGDKI
jgi:hypothetical protein